MPKSVSLSGVDFKDDGSSEVYSVIELAGLGYYGGGDGESVLEENGSRTVHHCRAFYNSDSDFGFEQFSVYSLCRPDGAGSRSVESIVYNSFASLTGEYVSASVFVPSGSLQVVTPEFSLMVHDGGDADSEAARVDMALFLELIEGIGADMRQVSDELVEENVQLFNSNFTEKQEPRAPLLLTIDGLKIQELLKYNFR